MLHFCSRLPTQVPLNVLQAAMFSAKTLSILALVALSASSVSAQTCPLPAGVQPDLSGLVASCSNKTTICTGCLCNLTIALVPAFVAGGVTYNSSNPTGVDIAKITEISTACAQALAPEIAAALGPNAAALAGLVQCPLVADSASGNLTAASLPSCLSVEVLAAAFASADTTMKNATVNGTANSTANSTASATTTGMTMDMTNSTMTTTDTTAVVATQGPAASPAKTPAATPAASPAPATKSNSAAVASITAMATIGAAALAALLL